MRYMFSHFSIHIAYEYQYNSLGLGNLIGGKGMSILGKTQTYRELKRKIYLVLIPLYILALFSFRLFSTHITPFYEFIIPFLVLILIINWIFTFRDQFFRAIEIAMLLVLSVHHLLEVWKFIYMYDTTISTYMIWAPLFYMFVFISFQGKGLLWTIIIFLTTIVMGLINFSFVITQITLIHFYLASFIVIYVLNNFRKLILFYIDSNMLKRLAYYDPLTNIANRRLIQSWLEEEVKSSHSTGRALAVIFLDVDHFKKINDQHGHGVGDEVLQQLTEIVKNAIGAKELFGRMGGEEFIIITGIL